MKINYIELATDFTKLCKNVQDSLGIRIESMWKHLKNNDTTRALAESASYRPTFASYTEEMNRIFDLLERIDPRFTGLTQSTSRLTWGEMFDLYPSPSELSEYLDMITQKHNELYEPHVRQLALLVEEEKLRINEAYHNLKEGCFWSSIVNCAVALEKRLFEIMNRRNPEFIKKRFPKKIFMFGQLIRTYIDNAQEFNNCIPAEYVKLLELINSYRIPSAHAKEFSVKITDASAVFDLTISFLINENCQPPKKKGRKKKQDE